MNVTCNDREHILLDGIPEQWAALEQHAANCQECAEELRAWRSLSVAAQQLRNHQDSPVLWNKIETALRREQQRRSARRSFWKKCAFWKGLSLGWQAALASAFVLVLAAYGAYVVLQPNKPNVADSKLLKNSALAEVERSQREYMKAIDRLSVEAKAQLDSPASPLMASYKEKLMVLDSAIDELRMQAGRNPSNAHLRNQLLAMYQEKQETLKEVLETKP